MAEVLYLNHEIFAREFFLFSFYAAIGEEEGAPFFKKKSSGRTH